MAPLPPERSRHSHLEREEGRLRVSSSQMRKSGGGRPAAGCSIAQIAASSASPPDTSQVPRPVSSWNTFTMPSSTYIA